MARRGHAAVRGPELARLEAAVAAGAAASFEPSPIDAIEIGASGRCFSASPAARSSSRSPIIVVAELRAMSSVSAWIAAAHTDVEPSSRSSRSYATRTCGREGSRAIMGGPGWPRCMGVFGVDILDFCAERRVEAAQTIS